MTTDPQQFKQQMLNLIQWHQDRGVFYPFQLTDSMNALQEDSTLQLGRATPNISRQKPAPFFKRHGSWPANLIFISLASDSSNETDLLAEEWQLYQRIEAAATNAARQRSKSIACCLYVINRDGLQEAAQATSFWNDLTTLTRTASATKPSHQPLKTLVFGRAATTLLMASCTDSTDIEKLVAMNSTHELSSLLKQPALKKDTWQQLQAIITEI